MKETEVDIYDVLENNECDIAFVMKDTHSRFVRDIRYNADCGLEWVGTDTIASHGLTCDPFLITILSRLM